MFALLRDRPEFDSATTQLRMFDSSGRLIAARVTWVSTIAPGPMPQCGYFTQPDKPVRLLLDGPLLRPIGPSNSTIWPTATVR